MVARFTIGGEDFRRVPSYALSEDSTPVSVSDSFGGFGTLTLSTPGSSADRALEDAVVTLEDDMYGSTEAVVVSVDADDDLLTFGAESRMSRLMVDMQTQPFTGTLRNALLYYFALVGLVDQYIIDDAIGNRSVTLPGWFGNGWHFINKELLPAHGAEMALVSGNIVVRPVRTLIVDRSREVSADWSLRPGEMADRVEVSYFPTQYKTVGLAYPRLDLGEHGNVISVQSRGFIEMEYDLGLTSLSSVQQPVAVDSVARAYSASSVYSVIDKEGKPFSALRWQNAGGKVEVVLHEDTSTITVRVTGPSLLPLEDTYRLAGLAGEDEPYSTLRIVGEGVFSSEQVITLRTGADPRKVTREVGVSVRNRAIQTSQDAVQLGGWVVKDWGSGRFTMDVEAVAINRTGETGDQSYATFGDFDAATLPNQTFGDFDASWPGSPKFEDFDAYWYAQVADRFANQAFGNIGGARLPDSGNYLRIRSAKVSPDGISYEAEEDNIFSDFDAAWADVATFGDFDVINAGMTFGQFDLEPLPGVDAE